jgi:hypothetical protein
VRWKVTAGAVVSRTVTVKLPVASLPAASLAEQSTIVSPKGKVLPEAGEQVTRTEPSLSSVAEGAGSNVTAVPSGPVASTVISAGSERAGGVMSRGGAFRRKAWRDPSGR